MTKAYDKYYQKENYFGNPYKELLDFISTLDKRKTILDIGCGQGRDSIAIGRLGYNVVGLDSSKVGIAQLNEKAINEGIDVKGIVGDMNSFEKYSDYDVLILDSMFHFYMNDIDTETTFLNTLLTQLKKEGYIIIFMQSGKKREKILKESVNKSPLSFEVIEDKYIMFKEFSSEYLMYIIQKAAK